MLTGKGPKHLPALKQQCMIHTGGRAGDDTAQCSLHLLAMIWLPGLLFLISGTFPRLMGVHKWIYFLAATGMRAVGVEEEKAQEKKTELMVPILKSLLSSQRDKIHT